MSIKSSSRECALGFEPVPEAMIRNVLNSSIPNPKNHPPSHHAAGSGPGGPPHAEPACIQFVGDSSLSAAIVLLPPPIIAAVGADVIIGFCDVGEGAAATQTRKSR